MRSNHKNPPCGWTRRLPGKATLAAILIALSCAAACMRAENPDGRLREINPVREARDGRTVKATQIAEFPLGAPPRSFAFAGDALYVFLNREGVAILDVSEPASPRVTGLLDERERHPELGPHFFLSGWVDGDRLIIANRHHGLALYDITDPLIPRYIDSYPMPYNELLQGLRLGRDFIIPAGGHGLYRTPGDLSNAAAPDQLVKHFDYVKGVKLYPPHWLLVADDYDFGLQVINVADRDAPRLATAFNTGNHCDEVEVFDGFVAVNNRSLGVLFLGMKRPWDPQLLSYLMVNRLTGVRAIHKLSKDRMAVAYSSGAFDVIDVEDPRRPLWLARIPVGADINCLTSHDSLVYVGLNNPPWEPSERTAMQLKVFRLEEVRQ